MPYPTGMPSSPKTARTQKTSRTGAGKNGYEFEIKTKDAIQGYLENYPVDLGNPFGDDPNPKPSHIVKVDLIKRRMLQGG